MSIPVILSFQLKLCSYFCDCNDGYPIGNSKKGVSPSFLKSPLLSASIHLQSLDIIGVTAQKYSKIVSSLIESLPLSQIVRLIHSKGCIIPDSHVPPKKIHKFVSSRASLCQYFYRDSDMPKENEEFWNALYRATIDGPSFCENPLYGSVLESRGEPVGSSWLPQHTVSKSAVALITLSQEKFKAFLKKGTDISAQQGMRLDGWVFKGWKRIQFEENSVSQCWNNLRNGNGNVLKSWHISLHWGEQALSPSMSRAFSYKSVSTCTVANQQFAEILQLLDVICNLGSDDQGLGAFSSMNMQGTDTLKSMEFIDTLEDRSAYDAVAEELAEFTQAHQLAISSLSAIEEKCSSSLALHQKRSITFVIIWERFYGLWHHVMASLNDRRSSDRSLTQLISKIPLFNFEPVKSPFFRSFYSKNRELVVFLDTHFGRFSSLCVYNVSPATVASLPAESFRCVDWYHRVFEFFGNTYIWSKHRAMMTHIRENNEKRFFIRGCVHPHLERFAPRSYGGGALADEMGLGKSLEVLSVCMLDKVMSQTNSFTNPALNFWHGIHHHLCQLRVTHAARAQYRRLDGGYWTSSLSDNSKDVELNDGDARDAQEILGNFFFETDAYSCLVDEFKPKVTDPRSKFVSVTFLQADKPVLQFFAPVVIPVNVWGTQKVEIKAKDPIMRCHRQLSVRDRYTQALLSRWGSCLCGHKFYEDQSVENEDSGILVCCNEDCCQIVHEKCVILSEEEKSKNLFRCPWCWLRSCYTASMNRKTNIVLSKSTLIVSPQSIANQWLEESKTHFGNGLRTVRYDGLLSSRGFRWVSPLFLASFDIIVVTFKTLLSEIFRPSSSISLSRVSLKRSSRKSTSVYNSWTPLVPSPLGCMQFSRVCVDEAQLVQYSRTARNSGDTTSSFGEQYMPGGLAKLRSCFLWYVSGTPLHDMKRFEQSLEKLTSCFRMLPPAFKTQMIYYSKEDQRAHEFIKSWNVRAVAPLFIRHTKRFLQGEFGLPPLALNVHWIRLPRAERMFYQLSVETAQDHWNEYLNGMDNMVLKFLEKSKRRRSANSLDSGPNGGIAAEIIKFYAKKMQTEMKSLCDQLAVAQKVGARADDMDSSSSLSAESKISSEQSLLLTLITRCVASIGSSLHRYMMCGNGVARLTSVLAGEDQAILLYLELLKTFRLYSSQQFIQSTFKEYPQFVMSAYHTAWALLDCAHAPKTRCETKLPLAANAADGMPIEDVSAQKAAHSEVFSAYKGHLPSTILSECCSIARNVLFWSQELYLHKDRVQLESLRESRLTTSKQLSISLMAALPDSDSFRPDFLRRYSRVRNMPASLSTEVPHCPFHCVLPVVTSASEIEVSNRFKFDCARAADNRDNAKEKKSYCAIIDRVPMVMLFRSLPRSRFRQWPQYFPLVAKIYVTFNPILLARSKNLDISDSLWDSFCGPRAKPIDIAKGETQPACMLPASVVLFLRRCITNEDRIFFFCTEHHIKQLCIFRDLILRNIDILLSRTFDLDVEAKITWACSSCRKRNCRSVVDEETKLFTESISVEQSLNCNLFSKYAEQFVDRLLSRKKLCTACKWLSLLGVYGRLFVYCVDPGGSSLHHMLHPLVRCAQSTMSRVTDFPFQSNTSFKTNVCQITDPSNGRLRGFEMVVPWGARSTSLKQTNNESCACKLRLKDVEFVFSSSLRELLGLPISEMIAQEQRSIQRLIDARRQLVYRAEELLQARTQLLIEGRKEQEGSDSSNDNLFSSLPSPSEGIPDDSLASNQNIMQQDSMLRRIATLGRDLRSISANSLKKDKELLLIQYNLSKQYLNQLIGRIRYLRGSLRSSSQSELGEDAMKMLEQVNNSKFGEEDKNLEEVGDRVNSCCVCMEDFDSRRPRVYFACGHCVCKECFCRMARRNVGAAFGGNRGNFKVTVRSLLAGTVPSHVNCPICRVRHSAHDAMMVGFSTKAETSDETSYVVNENEDPRKYSLLHKWDSVSVYPSSHAERLVETQFGQYRMSFLAAGRKLQVLCAFLLQFSIMFSRKDRKSHDSTSVSGVVVFASNSAVLTTAYKTIKHCFSVGSNRNPQIITRDPHFFNTCPECCILLLPYAQGAHGLSLVKANHLVMFDPHPFCDVERQAIARIHRIGQRRTCNIHVFVVRDTTEEAAFTERHVISDNSTTLPISSATVIMELRAKYKLKDADLRTVQLLKWMPFPISLVDVTESAVKRLSSTSEQMYTEEENDYSSENRRPAPGNRSSRSEIQLEISSRDSASAHSRIAIVDLT